MITFNFFFKKYLFNKFYFEKLNNAKIIHQINYKDKSKSGYKIISRLKLRRSYESFIKCCNLSNINKK